MGVLTLPVSRCGHRLSNQGKPEESDGQTMGASSERGLTAEQRVAAVLTAQDREAPDRSGGLRERTSPPMGRPNCPQPPCSIAVKRARAGDRSLHGPRPRKCLDQYWLRDRRVLQRIVAAARIHPEDRLLEIGPGRGALTDHLLATPAAVAVELGHQLINGLQQRFGADGRFSLLLLQKQVADRITAPAGSPACGALTIRMQLLAAAQSICTVAPDCFFPAPEVTSAVVALTPYGPDQRRYAPEQAPLLERLLQVAYGGRRKMLPNTLGGFCWSMPGLEQAARQAAVNLNQRPQDINPRQWLALSQALALPLP